MTVLIHKTIVAYILDEEDTVFVLFCQLGHRDCCLPNSSLNIFAVQSSVINTLPPLPCLSSCQVWGNSRSHTDMSTGSSKDQTAVIIHHPLCVWGSAQYCQWGQCGPCGTTRTPALPQVSTQHLSHVQLLQLPCLTLHPVSYFNQCWCLMVILLFCQM